MPDPTPEGDRARGLSAPAPARAGEPTLLELVAAAWRRWGRLGRAALVLAGVLALAFAAWLLFGRGGGSFSYDGGQAPPFSLGWGGELERVDPRPGQLLALASGEGERLSIRPLDFDEIQDEPLPDLALAAAAERLPPGRRVVLEGRTELAVDRGPEAYQIAYRSTSGGGAIEIGKRLFVPDPDRPGQGVEIEIEQVTDDPRVIEKVREMPAGFFLNWPIQLLLEDAASVRTAEGLEEPLRSFAFG